MPRELPRPCTTPGCPALVPGGGKCPKHFTATARAVDDRRGTSASRGYGHGWRKRRDFLLQRPRVTADGRDVPPGMCELCVNALAIPIDHIVPKSRGGSDKDDNLQRLCWSCHSSKTAREDGGFGRATSPPRA